jgi:hypothetical protein
MQVQDRMAYSTLAEKPREAFKGYDAFFQSRDRSELSVEHFMEVLQPKTARRQRGRVQASSS